MPTVEADRAKIIRRLTREGWVLHRHGAAHDVYVRSPAPGVVIVPRHRTLSPGVARAIAKAAGWA